MPASAAPGAALALAPCTSIEADCGMSAALLQAAQFATGRDIGRLRPFLAVPPYSVLVNGQAQAIELGGKARRFDFSGNRPFVNPDTGVADSATLLAWNARGDRQAGPVLAGKRISNEGIAGRVYQSGGRRLLTYVAGDLPVAGKCRSQMASFPVPARRRFLFDLSFQAGEQKEGREWHMTPAGKSPALIWQLKAPDVIPSLAIVVDTDPDDPRRLQFSFSRKGGSSPAVGKVGNALSLRPGQPVRLLMDVFFDERDAARGGRGYWRVWANGRLVVDVAGPTLSSLATQPHQWFLALYLYNDAEPLPFSRTIAWGHAKMLTAE
ncbi:MAG: hypothetical protein ABIK82_23750 [Pseudomonadota bacterium]